ncbi:MAG: hypothetical protein HWD59_09900 [Coxiellaceae bacterium]|nr:MAG: hypothetical protein HWD59_09900 [Coxiellaceae bacterium]
MPTCYVSYCHESGIDHKVKLILECLSAVNIRWQCLIPSMKSVFIGKYIQQIDIADHIILIGNPALTTQHHEKDYEDAKILEFNANFVLSKDAKLPAIVCREIARIDQRHKQAASNDIFTLFRSRKQSKHVFQNFYRTLPLLILIPGRPIMQSSAY